MYMILNFSFKFKCKLLYLTIPSDSSHLLKSHCSSVDEEINKYIYLKS